MEKKSKRIVVVGSGNAGLLAALTYNYNRYDVIVITTGESIQVGESTSFAMPYILRLLNINEAEWMECCDAVFKFSVNFEDWSGIGTRYSHPFAYPGEYGYHYDVGSFTNFLRKKCIERGIKIITDKIVSVEGNINGIREVNTTTNGKISGDYFIDCTGFQSVLLGTHYNQNFISFHKNIILNDRAVLLQSRDNINEKNYTSCTSLTNGWMWTISLKSRTDHGYVYSSDYITDDLAEHELRIKLNNFNSPARHIKYKPGRYEKSAIKNCIGIGLSSGFIEPLESTGYGFIVHGILQSLRYISGQITETEYNHSMKDVYTCSKHFIELHYYMCKRDDTPYWKYYKKFKPSDERLKQIVDTYSNSVNTPHGKTHFEYTIKGMNLVDTSLNPPWL